MHYLIYKITNRLDNKIYVGKHKTEDKNDDYFGSGLLLGRAVEKHGKEHFTKEILMECQSEEEMNQRELDIVDEDFVLRNDTYNIVIGGQGGWSYILKNKLNQTETLFESCRRTSHLGVEKMRELWKDPEFRRVQSEERSSRMSEYISSGKHPFVGKKHSEESKKHLSDVMKVLHSSEKNPVRGRVWITNEIESRMIFPTDPIPCGFRRGMSTSQREKLRVTNEGKTMSPEARKKIGDAVRERHRLKKMVGSVGY